MSIQEMDYETLRKELEQLPQTWYPDLIRAMVEASYRRQVWKPGGCSRFIQQVEKMQEGSMEQNLSFEGYYRSGTHWVYCGTWQALDASRAAKVIANAKRKRKVAVRPEGSRDVAFAYAIGEEGQVRQIGIVGGLADRG